MPKPFRTTVIGSYFRRDSQALRRPTLTREEANAHVRWAIDEQVRAGKPSPWTSRRPSTPS